MRKCNISSSYNTIFSNAEYHSHRPKSVADFLKMPNSGDSSNCRSYDKPAIYREYFCFRAT